MKYEEFIYELIKLLLNWGMWKDSIKILCGEKSICQSDSSKITYKDLRKVIISDMTLEEKELMTGMGDECQIYVELNCPLNNLFEYGILVAELEDLPLNMKEKAYQKNEGLQNQFFEEYDMEEIRHNPEEYGIPSDLEFDSADEYESFLAEEYKRLENDFIANITGKIEYNNELEAEICELCIKHGLSYEFTGDALLIGSDFFERNLM